MRFDRGPVIDADVRIAVGYTPKGERVVARLAGWAVVAALDRALLAASFNAASEPEISNAAERACARPVYFHYEFAAWRRLGRRADVLTKALVAAWIHLE